MSEPTLEARVTALEQLVARLLQERTGPLAQPPGLGWWESPHPPSNAEERRAFDEMTEYGRYFRRTGKESPPDWKTGDPIPEVDE